MTYLNTAAEARAFSENTDDVRVIGFPSGEQFDTAFTKLAKRFRSSFPFAAVRDVKEASSCVLPPLPRPAPGS